MTARPLALLFVLALCSSLFGFWTHADAVTPDCVPNAGSVQPRFGGLYNDRIRPASGQPQTNDLGYVGDGCDKHHMPAAAAYDLAKLMTGGPQNLDRRCGTAILMEKADHDKTASNDKAAGSHPQYPFGKDPDTGVAFTSAADYRLKQAQLIKDGRLADAFQMDVDDIRRKFGSKYDRNISDALNAMSRMPGCNQALSQNGGTAMGRTALSPATVSLGGTVTVRSTGDGALPSGVSVGDPFDLRFADSQQLLRSPICALSPMIVSTQPVPVTASGDIAPITVTLGATTYWEARGEDHSTTIATGQGQLCFTRSYGADFYTAPTSVTVTQPTC